DLLVDTAGDENVAWSGNSFQARRDVDALTVDVVRLNNHVTKMNADPIQDTLLVRQRGIAADHALLNDDCAAHGFNRAVEHGQETIARMLDGPAVMLGDGWLDEFAPMPLDASMGSFLIHAHQPAVSRDIGRDDCSQAARHLIRRRRSVFTTPDGINLAAR